jgi:hypothetical protein
MNYKKVYESIIQKRIQTPIDSGEYVERHHIVPRSLGGDDNETNLIRLTAREHFICHALLAEMYEEGTNEWYKLNHAFMMMKAESAEHGGNRYINSRLYALKKEDFSKVMSYVQGGSKNSQHGRVWIYNLNLEQNIKVHNSEIYPYLENGWVKGRVVDFHKLKEKEETKLLLKESKEYYNGKLLTDYLIGIIQNNFDIVSSDKIQLVTLLKDMLYEQYVVNNKSTNDLAREYNLTNPTIRKYLIWLGIGTRERNGKWI